MDGRASERARIPRARLPFEFARCTRRIKYQNSISSGIAILRDSRMVPLPLALPPARPLDHPLSPTTTLSPLSRCLSTSEHARRALYQRECARILQVAGGRGRAHIHTGKEKYTYISTRMWRFPGKTTVWCGHDAHLQSENSLKMSFPIAPTAKDRARGSSCTRSAARRRYTRRRSPGDGDDGNK